MRFEALLERQERGELSQIEAASMPGGRFAGGAREILCIEEERVVGNDNAVQWKRLSLQIPTSPLRPHWVCPEYYARGAVISFLPSARWRLKAIADLGRRGSSTRS